ncbi:MAG: GDSL-type esterase/lipase family protein [Candidatus Thermoplasmatota archaeon]|nr:GDSL-type esterase/lipase family protein [Candidatus Thermoplasmatota archaeon]
MDIIFLGDSLTEGITGASFFNILKGKLPEHNLVNRGKGGDTVISLVRRVKKMDITKKYDIAFLWVGANDVLANKSILHKSSRLICNQAWTKSATEFRMYYVDAINTIKRCARKIFTISPLLTSEIIDSKWNKELQVLSDEMREMSSEFENVEFIDLQEDFFKYLLSKKSAKYDMKIRDILFSFFLKNDEDFDKLSKKRGLFLTCDGVHLNSVGANIVAGILYKKIVDELK